MAVPGQAILSRAIPTADAVGDELEAIVREHAHFVYKVAYSVLHNHHDAEDATQETFLRVWRYRKELARVRELRAWLARIAWRVALNRRRKVPEIRFDEACDAIEQLHGTGASVEQIAQSREMMALMEHLIATLPRKLREPLVLSSVEEMTSVEVAAVWGFRRPRCARGCCGRGNSCAKNFQRRWKENMRGKEQDHFIDELLNAGLARYQSAEPRPGLEERLLANLRTRATAEAGLPWAGWPALATAAVVLVVAGAIYLARQATSPPMPAPAMARTAPEPVSAAPVVAAARVGPATILRVRPAGREPAPTVPRRDRFPSPVPLSEQELLLVSYVSRASADLLERRPAFGQPIQDLKIAPLQIPRLVTESSVSSQIDRHGR